MIFWFVDELSIVDDAGICAEITFVSRTDFDIDKFDWANAPRLSLQRDILHI